MIIKHCGSKLVLVVKTFLHRFVVCILKQCQQRNVSSTKSISTVATTMVEKQEAAEEEE